ncbi:AAA family ATPase [Dyadobacter chenwenxiniae]|uniref:AAA family ATPase n=1 Tax=Dyadobacter chenwenxiniae TaxID=2906456 RepID=A0A9X1PPG4_9BACT|nr:AAA family ATPase [Dyadobacter chenwenxiniae]MCF0065107.1 AAA family ATPase [Dyadobacter chenwenxiniae]UON84621.1 AAA family ATPase [Dyadobacter chenwenxiniae]
MNINFIHIQNFRKLKDCRIDFSDSETVFVGANNSGKTTAIDALIQFLKLSNNFSTRDLTLSNWKEINAIGEDWLKEADFSKIDLTLNRWESNLPALDIWLKVENYELHYINRLIPSLDWEGGLLGMRLRFEPKNIEELYREFCDGCNSSRALNGLEPKKKKDTFSLWPKDMWDFLDKKLSSYFTVRTYLLDPNFAETPQKLSSFDVPIEGDALNGLIKIDIINAQRGFSDVNADLGEAVNTTKTLSSQLRSYYDRHLNPAVNPTKDDITALRAIHAAKELFDANLKGSFQPSLQELELLNYPGLGSARINLSSKFNTVDSLNHDSSVQYFLEDGISELTLPEKYNGLGYQNLISIIFKLIRFRDEWMQVGKIAKSAKQDVEFEPLHLVLIEEPEAHLHAQVQQVFVKEAYKVLRRHPHLGENKKFSTQLVISTHSNHVAHEVNFTALRYFRRNLDSTGKIGTSQVVNLSKTFGKDDDTTKFAIRYLKTTHCDLFFADAVIMVEGPAERMLLPYFIKHHSKLSNCYISILEIGGSHAHRLRPLIENLGVITLVVTDIDSVDGQAKARPEKGKKYNTGNDTLKSWIPNETALDKLLLLKETDKEDKKLPIKIAFQIPLTITNGQGAVKVNPYTFEDSLVMENKDLFGKLTEGTGLLKQMINASKETDPEKSAQAMYDAITQPWVKKAEFALELFYFEEPNKLATPKYIKQGLDWLETKLIAQKKGLNNLTK